MHLRLCARRPPAISLLCPLRLPLSRICQSQSCLRTAAQARQLSVEANAPPIPGRSSGHGFLEEYKNSFTAGTLTESLHLGTPSENEKYVGELITVHGFLGKRKDLSENLSFIQLALAGEHDGSSVQVVSRVEDGSVFGPAASQDVHQKLKNIKPHSAVSISAVLEEKRQPKGKSIDPKDTLARFSKKNLELVLQDITCLAAFPDDIIVSEDAQFGAGSRHLQIRFDLDLKKRIHFRNRVLKECRITLGDFQEIETPVLFKSTPEGAREFLVPTRKAGYAYALPQSPQQYKQILMASGIHRYFQIAKCFRDEDLRADRQPEFTQLDLEMAFSDGDKVMQRVEHFISMLFSRIQGDGLVLSPPRTPFLRITYQEAMQKYGSDKPDLRIPNAIQPVDEILSQDLIGMITSLSNPIVESWKLHLSANSSTVRRFVQGFMDSPEATSFQKNLDGAPGIFVFDPRKPLEGLQAFGYEGAESLKKLYAELNTSSNEPNRRPSISSPTLGEPFREGDLIIVQARPRTRLCGGSTTLGRLRTALHQAALSKGLITQSVTDYFLWVTDFPLFTLNNGVDPGQGGSAGFSATHHPFTAPKTAADVGLLLTNPLEVIADHYDLVFNGVELGGGSRRIHNSEMQQFVMRDVLKMREDRLEDFAHLFEALRAGCPPHAGIALGLDRLVAVMLGVSSVRDVIAFPKSGKGEDLLVKSPSRMTREQQETYHLTVLE